MKVEVVDHNLNWKYVFNEESQILKEIFGDEVVDIFHIGSTSVEGLQAKPIIDIMPVVKRIENVDEFTGQMAEAGFEALGEFGIKGRRYFRKGGNTRTHQIHVFQEDNQHDIIRHLAVRDYLRAYSEESLRYGKLKKSLADKFPNDIESYVEGKDAFVKELERKALRWYKDADRS